MMTLSLLGGLTGCGTYAEWDNDSDVIQEVAPTVQTEPSPIPIPIPLEAAPANAPANDPASATDEYAGWSTHQIGEASFRHPSNWQVDATTYGLILVPGDHRAGQELILITGSDAAGIRQPTDARVGQTLDAMMASSMPGLRRRRQPQPVAAGHDRKGARYDYVGQASDGRAAQASTYVLIDAGKAAAISMVADPSTLTQRRTTIERIFHSFSAGDPQGQTDASPLPADLPKNLDQRLIGMFAGESIYSGNDVYLNTQFVYALGADGVIFSGAKSHINASQGNGSGGFRWTATGQTDANSRRGTWTARQNRLTIRWDSGETATVAYGFEPDGTLALRNAANGKLINIYNRVR